MKTKTKQRETLEQILTRVAEILFLDSDAVITVNTRDADGDTPLHIVALWGDRHAIETLVNAGADIDAKGDMGCTPLHFAVMGNHVQAAELLLLLGANPNIASELSYTPKALAKQSENNLMIKVFRSTHPSRHRK